MANAKNPYILFRVSIAGNINCFKIIHPPSVFELNKEQKSKEVSFFSGNHLRLTNIFFYDQAGPHICLGKEFAYRQMKILAATLNISSGSN
jgi:hypothetical protein